MHTYKVTLILETYSAQPEDWVAETIVDSLEEGETVKEVKVERV